VIHPTGSISTIIGGCALIVLVCIFVIWSVFRRERSDKFIELASLTTVLFVLMMAAIKSGIFPDWVLEPLAILLGSQALVSLFFLLRWGYRALRQRGAPKSAHELKHK
jgi:heme A synthase